MKPIITVLCLLITTLQSLLAQSNQSLFIQYKNGVQIVIEIPSTSKQIEKDNLSINTPYGYKLRLVGNDITKKYFIVNEPSQDSERIQIKSEKDKVIIRNPTTNSNSYIYDRDFKQVMGFEPGSEVIELKIGNYDPGLYWMSCSGFLIGVDSSTKNR